MMADINIKRGATLSETLSFTTACAPTVLTGMTMEAMVRTAEGALVATLTLAPTSTVGQATIYVQDTSAWPEGLLAVDVMIAAPGGAKTLSQTFSIQVEHAETYTLPPQAPYDPVADT